MTALTPLQWLLVETLYPNETVLVALRVADGARRTLYVSGHERPLDASLSPDGQHAAILARAEGQSGSRLGLIELETGALSALDTDLDPHWMVHRVSFDDTGERLLIEGTFRGASASECLVVTRAGDEVRVEAGVKNSSRLPCRMGTFLPGGAQLLYLTNVRPDDMAWEVGLLDLEKPGDSALAMEGRARSVLQLTLTDAAAAAPEQPLVYAAGIRRAFYVGLNEGRQRLHSLELSGKRTALGAPHRHIDALCISASGAMLAYVADGQIFMAETQTGAVMPLVDGDPEAVHRGLVFDVAGGRLLFWTHGEPTRLRAVDLLSREVTTLHSFKGGRVHGAHALPEGAAAQQSELCEVQLDEDSSVKGTPPPRVAGCIEPGAHFATWLAELPNATDPGERLRALEACRGDAAVLQASLDHLKALVKAPDTGPLVFALAAVAHLRHSGALGLLRRLCSDALRLLTDEGELPALDGHFALAAARYILSLDDRFDAISVFEAHAELHQRRREALGWDDEDAAQRLFGAFRLKYEGPLEEVVRTVSPEEEGDWIRAHVQAEQAELLTAQREAQRVEAEALAEAECLAAKAQAEAEVKAARAAVLQARLDAAQEAAEARAADELLAAKAEVEAAREVAEMVARAEAEAEAEAAEAAAQVEWASLRLEAERSAAEAEVKAEAAWVSLRLEAERSAAEAVADAEAEAEADRKAALATEAAEAAAAMVAKAEQAAQAAAAARAQVPVEAQPTTGASPMVPSPMVSSPMVSSSALDDAPDMRVSDSDFGDETITTPTPPPLIIPAAGLALVFGGLAQLLVGGKLGGFSVLGVLLIVGGMLLWRDRRWSWLAALGALGVNGLYLLGFGMGGAPAWVGPVVPILGGLLSLGLLGALVQPGVRARYQRSRL